MAALDSLLGGTYGVSSFLALLFLGVAAWVAVAAFVVVALAAAFLPVSGFSAFVVMLILFYVYIINRYPTVYFITARMSKIFNIPFGFFLRHSPIFDNLLGGTYGVSSLLAAVALPVVATLILFFIICI
jgi:hypothetical protein